MKLRLYGLDYLKVLLTVLVIAHHAGQPYGGSNGFWYFLSADQPIALGVFFSTNAAFFMSLFFFISAYFMPASYERKGAIGFILDRVKQFALPLLFGFFVMIPLLMYVFYTQFRAYPAIDFWNYYVQIYFGFAHMPSNWSGPSWPDMQFAHLWFLQHLIVYTLIYALCRYILELVKKRKQDVTITLNSFHITIFAVCVALITFLVRINYPIDRWTGFLGFIQTEFAHVPQYAAFFLAGIVAYRNNWIERMRTQTGLLWLSIGVTITILRYSGVISIYAAGSWGWTAFLYACIETFVCFGLCIGLTWLFHKGIKRSLAWVDRLSSATFGVYVIHVPIIVVLQYAFANIAIPTYIKLSFVIVIGTATSFFVSMLYKFVVKKISAANRYQGDKQLNRQIKNEL